ncbi:MAG TPA: hypothetical protein VGH93_02285 [Solirubrobacteraceae bacterium]
MRVLLSFENFAAFGGTESYTLTVATELERLGHEVAIYSPNHGAMADFARGQGVNVVSRHELPASSDLLICSDTATCHELAGRYHDAVRIFVVHSVDFMVQAPPQLHDRCQAVVVLNDRVRRAVEARGWHAPIVRLRQPIDFPRFAGIGVGGSSARTAVVLGNAVSGARGELIEDACRASGLDVKWIGNDTNPTPTPEVAIAGSRLVIGLGRSVLEAMAAGRAAYVYGVIGGDGWVTPERYASMEADGFAGTSATDVVIDGPRMADDLRAWDEQMGGLNRDLVAAHHTAREHAIELVNLARRLDASPAAGPSVNEELAHLIRLQWQTEARAMANLAEADRVSTLLAQAHEDVAQLASVAQATNEQLEAAQNAARAADEQREALQASVAQAQIAVAQAQSAARAAHEQLEELRNTRRYRLACRIASPLDQIRARLRGAG